MNGNKLHRRAVLAGGCMGMVASALPSVAAGTRMPNILFLVSEDNNPFIGAYGDALAHTPTIDRLAREGVLFRNVYSNAPVCAPSRFGILTGVYPESCAPANHMRATARWPKPLTTYPEQLRQAGYFCANNAKTDYNCDVTPDAIWDRLGNAAHWRQRPGGQPFMAVFNYMTTHESRIFKPSPGRVTPDQIKLPAYLPDTPDIRQDFASYYNLMERMDEQLAERLAELEADGLTDDTIIFYYSDNGGVLPRSKRYCYDEGLRCSLVVRVPAKWAHLAPGKPGTERIDPVSFIDLAPTLLSLAGMKIPAQMQGQPFMGKGRRAAKRYAFGMRNRMDERYDFQRTVTDGRWRYIRNYMPHRPLGQHQAFAWLAKGYQDWETAHRAGTLTPVQDRFFQQKPFEELYDLSVDKDQVINLIDDPKAARVLKEMRSALDRHMLSINDNGFIPEASPEEGYVESNDKTRYPLKQIMALAATAARRDPANLGELQAHLRHGNPIMRHWAAAGLLMLGEKAAPALSDLLSVMRTEERQQTRIVAAEAVATLAQPDEAIGVLADLCAETRPWQVQLQAINALTFLGDKAKPALPVVQQAAEREQEFVRNAGRYLVAVLTGAFQPSTPIFDLKRMMSRPSAGRAG
ncbi:sulfatase-like hydrolase/transferase [Niveispirillum sp. SYP-B3756]|uniref:sulfatase-like hydrolase/transferase n=1 Tax=Niveispirillum sp. SYP-B3756 TaxID=2662178 RepID=UPI0012922CFE|nr:sulfatase-like hydrolase/transferase [Niveispirillum sp. SYP-B3756]MQP66390.1 sulfatase-like hydrolase/transferase [Niveispirillum sp. SYP-B3756]